MGDEVVRAEHLLRAGAGGGHDRRVNAVGAVLVHPDAVELAEHAWLGLGLRLGLGFGLEG